MILCGVVLSDSTKASCVKARERGLFFWLAYGGLHPTSLKAFGLLSCQYSPSPDTQFRVRPDGDEIYRDRVRGALIAI